MNCPECGIPIVRLKKSLLDCVEPATFAMCERGFCHHDDSCHVRRYHCENGHEVNLSLINRCTKCDWVGKKFCNCSIKVEHWPENEDSKPFFTGKTEKWHGMVACVTKETGE